MSLTVPFVVGQWVRGSSFYGRRGELDALLGDGPRCVWLAGLRRIGKTSLLRQLELHAGERGWVALYWDLQGVDGAEELALSFADALLEAEEVLAAHGIALAAEEGEDAPAALSRLLPALATRGVPLLLLVDEADELLRLAAAAATSDDSASRSIAELGEILLVDSRSRVVLAASPRAAGHGAQATGDAGGGLLAGVDAPRYLGLLADDEARALVRQSQLPPASRPPFDEAAVTAVCRLGGNHPMLLQLLGRRSLELGDVEEAGRQLAADHTLEHLFAADWTLLSDDERAALRAVARADESGEPVGVAVPQPAALARLRALGLVAVGAAGRPVVRHRFLREWLLARHPA